MLDMLQPKGKQTGYMIISERIKDLPACLPCTQEVHVTQSAQLMRYGGFAHCESHCQRTNAHLTFEQQGNDAYAAGVAESAEEFRKLDGFEFGEFHCMNI